MMQTRATSPASIYRSSRRKTLRTCLVVSMLLAAESQLLLRSESELWRVSPTEVIGSSPFIHTLTERNSRRTFQTITPSRTSMDKIQIIMPAFRKSLGLRYPLA